MARKRIGDQQIVTKQRQTEVLQGQGKTIAVACKEAGTTKQSYCRLRKEYGGLGVDQAKRPKRLQTENGRLRKPLVDLSTEIHARVQSRQPSWLFIKTLFIS